KDRVLLKSDGSYTYLMPDIAYHKNKFERGFDKIINVWGSDHHGYVPRMQAAIEALGYPSEKFSVNIIQLVNVLEDGEIVRMSKRTGKAVALRELMDDVGVDAVGISLLCALTMPSLTSMSIWHDLSQMKILSIM